MFVRIIFVERNTNLRGGACWLEHHTTMMIRRRCSFGLLVWSIIVFDNVTGVVPFTLPSTKFVVTTRPPPNHPPELCCRPCAPIQPRQYCNEKQHVTSSNTIFRICSSRSTLLYMSPYDVHGSTTFWTCVVEYFDGSNIIDPVVVSNVFWSRLQANLISVIIGQSLAAIVFSFLLSTAASQITKLLSYVSEEIFSGTTTTTIPRGNRPPLRIPRNLRDDSSTTAVVAPDFGKLLICIMIDTIGSSSVLIPFIGDASDVLWAPTAGLLLRYLFYNSNVIFIFELTEEILPFTDILPLATLCWIIDTYFRETDIAKLLQLGTYASSPSVTEKDRSDAIDVDNNSRDGRSNRNSKLRS